MPTQFDYLLNAMEHAAQEDNPAKAGYGAKRAALMDHVRALEADANRYRWLRDKGSAIWIPFTQQWRMESVYCDASVDTAMAYGQSVGDA